jgi:diguanylate cyclase (GGDEF)-like protein
MCRLVRNEAGVITAADESIFTVLGWRPDQLIGLPSTSLIHPNDQASAVGAWFAMIDTPGSTHVWHGRYRTADGHWASVETENVNHLDDPDVPAVHTVMRAATNAPINLLDELRSREELMTRLADALPVGVFQIDHNLHMTTTNGRLHGILGVPPAGDLAGQFAVIVAEDQALLDGAVASVLAGNEVDDLELRFGVSVSHPELARTRVCQMSLRPLTQGTDVVTGAIGCLTDVTDQVELRRELERRASTDALTGCLNRAAVFELLERSLRSPNADGTGVAVIFVDLDRFKLVNDELGHATGDHILLIVADRIRRAIRAGDAIGRIGGDEFVVVCPHVRALSEAVPVAERISSALREPFDANGEDVRSGASVGVAWSAATQSESPDRLIARADAAMYESKLGRAGKVVLADALP